MTVQVEDIRAWVDGELQEPQAGQIANAVLASNSLQKTADELRASQLPYREAYEQTSVPEVPESLRLKIKTLQDSAAQTTTVQSLDIQSPTTKNPTAQNLPTKAANNSRFKLAGIAASVLFAALVGYLAGTNTAEQSPDAVVTAGTPLQSENFAESVAAYQKFYVRDTLKGTVPPNPAKITERLTSQTDMKVIIPELEGYEFMRAQRLSVDGELLLQLVYLGAEGGPLALCYIVATSESESVTTTTLEKHHGLNTAEWRHNGHRFVIVSDAPAMKLEELAQSTQQQWNI